LFVTTFKTIAQAIVAIVTTDGTRTSS